VKYLLILLFSISLCRAFLCAGQDKKAPKNLKQAVNILQTATSDSIKNLIKKTPDDKLINISYPWGGQFKLVFEWINTDNEDKKIDKYLSDNGITYIPNKQAVILIAFKKHLLNQPIDEKAILKPYQDTQKKWDKEDAIRWSTDSLRGVYIPKDLQDCFKQIDKFWNDSTKRKVKSWSENHFVAEAHLGFGMWMRNNWQLWGGSRLSKYFDEIGISNPEDMSGIILTSYHRYLIGEAIRLQEQTVYYKDYWKKTGQKEVADERLKFEEYKSGDTVNYNYRWGYASERQENQWFKDSCVAKGIIIARNEKNLFIKVKILEACGKKGIVVYDSNKTLEYDKVLRKMIKPKKRIIKFGHTNKIFWFRYDDWETAD